MSDAAQSIVLIREADLGSPQDQESIVALTCAYAQDPMGCGKALEPETREQLIAGLQHHPTTLILLAEKEGEPVGIATCFVGFSTFAAKPLINIHDLAVSEAFRGQGIGRQLLAAVEQAARERGYCAVTLEVEQRNELAHRTYLAFGFVQEHHGPGLGSTLYLKKSL